MGSGSSAINGVFSTVPFSVRFRSSKGNSFHSCAAVYLAQASHVTAFNRVTASNEARIHTTLTLNLNGWLAPMAVYSWRVTSVIACDPVRVTIIWPTCTKHEVVPTSLIQRLESAYFSSKLLWSFHNSYKGTIKRGRWLAAGFELWLFSHWAKLGLLTWAMVFQMSD